MHPLLRLLQTGWLLLALVLPVEAWAHASLIAAEPEDGAVVQQAPGALVLRFDEPVQLIRVSVIGPQGPVSATPASDTEAAVLRLALPAALPHGTYLASWRVISADGHPIAGTIAFGIGAPPAAAAAAAPIVNDDNWADAASLLRFLLYAVLAFGAGGALFRAGVAEPSPALRHWMGRAALCGVPIALLAIGVQGGAMLDGRFPHALAEIATWRAALGATLAHRAMVVMLGLVVTAIMLSRSGHAARRLGGAGAIIAVAGLGLSGHAAAGGWGMQALLVVHALAACFWIGALVPLLGMLAADRPVARAAIRRFSALALPAVALLLVSGVIQAARHLPDTAALLAGRYGQLVLIKAALAALLLVLAGLNRQRLTPALMAGRMGAGRALGWSIRGELGLAGGVLGVTALLTMTNPHAHTAAAEQHDHAAHHQVGAVVAASGEGVGVTLRVDPARVGINRLAVALASPDGASLAAQEVWVELAHAEAGVVGLRRQMHAAAPGLYAYEGPELAVAGAWTAHVDVLLGDFDQRTVSLQFQVGTAP